MSAQTVSRALTNSSDANFRAWGKAISDQMALGGWVLTTDSGQINWTTVLAPTTGGAVAGYEVWRSADAAGGIVQLYVKIEYGSGSVTNNPSVWVTAGWGSDGSGNINGTVIMPRRQITFTANATATPCNLAAGAGWFVFVLGNVNNSSSVISLERTRSGTNAEQNEILLIWNNSGTWGSQVAEKDNVVFAAETTNGMITPTSANAVVGGNFGISLALGTKGGFTGPSLNISGVNNGTGGAAQSTFAFNAYGAAHTYVVNANVLSINFAGRTNEQLLSRFE